MSVIGICGSLRENSNTNKIVKKVAECAGCEFELVYLAKVEVKPCTGCLSCMWTEGHCTIKDGMQELYDKLMDAEAIIIGSPAYYMNVSGAIKCFLDRKFALYFRGIGPPGSPYTGQRPLAGRPAVGVITAAETGEEWAMETLRNHFEINKMSVVGELAEIVGMNNVNDMPGVMERAEKAGKKVGEILTSDEPGKQKE
jgi:multimeric flavodoxin WrbA